MKMLLKALVGSRAHGLDNPDSDYDYRGVFVQPTTEILSIGQKTKNTNWQEGNDDDMSWELGHFLELSLQSNPSILETYMSPMYTSWDEGKELRELFPYVWDSKRVMDAFIGYGHNQRKKFLENKDNRANKYATAYIRVLYNAYELLSTGKFTSNLRGAPIYEIARRFKDGNYSVGEVIEETSKWEALVRSQYERSDRHYADLDKVNEFLIKVRKKYWKIDIEQ